MLKHTKKVCIEDIETFGTTSTKRQCDKKKPWDKVSQPHFGQVWG
jgi:hypothetical protein